MRVDKWNSLLDVKLQVITNAKKIQIIFMFCVYIEYRIQKKEKGMYSLLKQSVRPSATQLRK